MASELLTDKAISNTKPGDKPKTLKDGAGLFVLVHPNGSKYFQLRTTLHGKDKLVRLGTYPDMSLANARAKAKESRRLVDDGIDPVQDKRNLKAAQAVQAGLTFEIVAKEWLSTKNTIADSYREKIEGTLNANVYPSIGKLPINDISSPMLLSTLRKMESRGALELMGKCRAWLRQIFDYAKATGRLQGDNSVSCLVDVLKKPEGEGYPTFKNCGDAGLFLRRLIDYQGRAETKLAIWLMMLTAKRPSELRAASWSEFDFDKAEWCIPATRMKTRQPHVVTLSRQAVSALRELYQLTHSTGLLFPGNNPSKPISEGTLTKAFRLIWIEYKTVPHGCRHFFSTMANEHGQFRHDVIEAALAHKDKDAIRATYNRATYIQERRKLSQWWADELEVMRDGAKVLSFSKTGI